MTDPAIHSPIEDFGRDNKRTMGMAKFFETHVCNSICDQLKLTKQKLMTQLCLILMIVSRTIFLRFVCQIYHS